MEDQDKGDPEENQNGAIAIFPTFPEKSEEQQQLTCWLYISRTPNPNHQQQPDEGENHRVDGLLRSSLEAVILATEPIGSWHVSETRCGLIAGFAREADADKFLQHGDISRVFQGPVQVARFCDRDTRYRQAVLLRDVPYAIPLQDLNSALARQGITAGSVERLRHHVRVEVLESWQYEQLLRQGLDFFGAARFCAVPERWGRNNIGFGSAMQHPFAGNEASRPGQQQQSNDDVLQCYRCQGFWHVAANCRHLPRCVRCGEPHSVEFCSRPRSNPICCHCSGPHHAGYRQCPVRLQLLNATMVSLTLSANRLSSNTSLSQPLFLCGKSNTTNSNSGNSNMTPASSTTNQKPN